MEDVQLRVSVMSNEKEFIVKDPAEKTWHPPQGVFLPKILKPVLE